MKKSSFKDYIDNLSEQTLFNIKKTIIELTNNLDFDLLIELKIELHRYINNYINDILEGKRYKDYLRKEEETYL